MKEAAQDCLIELDGFMRKFGQSPESGRQDTGYELSVADQPIKPPESASYGSSFPRGAESKTESPHMPTRNRFSEDNARRNIVDLVDASGKRKVHLAFSMCDSWLVGRPGRYFPNEPHIERY